MEAKFISQNPLTHVVYKEFEFEKQAAIAAKIEQGEQAFQAWRKRSFAQRAQHFIQLAELLEAEVDQHARLICEEMGKPITQARAEIKKCALVCRFYAEQAANFLAPKLIDPDNKQGSYVHYEPLGLILQIMPWNFPFWQVFRCSAPTLMAGNTTLLKHAPNVPRCALQIADLFQRAGFPKHVFQTTFASVEATDFMLGHAGVQGVALTGSDRAGSAVGQLAGKHIKQLVLELGGSDAFIVLDDADLQQAAKVGVQSRFNNNGQTCIAAKRFIVQESVADQFLILLKDEISQLQRGDSLDDHAQLTGMARNDLAEQLQQQLDRSVEMGAKVELKGGRVGDTTQFDPVILSEITPEMPAYKEELFGPVLSLFVVKDEEQAITLANDTIYGLGAAVWTQDLARARRVAEQVEAGALAVNQLVRSAVNVPFGGIKRSGLGRELSREGILEFVNVKSIVMP